MPKRLTPGWLSNWLTFSSQHIKSRHNNTWLKPGVDIVGILSWRPTFRTWLTPVTLVLDLRIVHDHFGSSSDPSLNGHLHYPNDVDKSLNEKRKYHSDCDSNPPSAVSFMPAIISTSRRLHSEFIRLLFLQIHRGTDRRSSVSQQNCGLFHFLHATFSTTLNKSRVTRSESIDLTTIITPRQRSLLCLLLPVQFPKQPSVSETRIFLIFSF